MEIAIPPPLFEGLEKYIKIARNDSLTYGQHRSREGRLYIPVNILLQSVKTAFSGLCF